MANRFQVGDLDVLVVSDGDVTFPAHAYFPASTKEAWGVHDRWLDHEGNLTFPYTCFLVRSGDRRVLIDTGVGDVAIGVFKGGALLSELAANGVQPEDVDAVFLTHSHLDHVGTAALKSGAATFPNATYHMTQTEMDFWAERPENDFGRHDVDARAFILGDAISCPVQLTETEWSGAGDVDPAMARRSQEALMRELEGTSALVGAAHFPGLTFGRVMMGEGRRYWAPALATGGQGSLENLPESDGRP
jgi:glyoxylase-like metal-dependent hydrolase (beta-lactamase superfamily II)